MGSDRSPGAPASSRRAFLRSAAGALGLVTATSAGCVETLPPLGRRIRFGDVAVPEAGEPTYREWVPAASATSDRLRPFFGATSVRPGDVAGDVVALPITLEASSVGSRVDYFGVGYEHYDELLDVGPATVLRGDVDPAHVADTLLASGYQRAEPYEGYRCFQRPDWPRFAAVADGTIVWAQYDRGVDRARRTVEAVVDAGSGRIARKHEEDRHFERLTDAAGARPSVRASENFVDDEVAYDAWAVGFDEERVYHVSHELHEEPVSERAIREELRHNGVALSAHEVQVDVDGRMASVAIATTHETVREQFEFHRRPQVTWGFEEGDDELTVRHEAGDTVEAERIELGYSPSPNSERPRLADAQFADEHDVVVPGDAVTVSTDPDGHADSVTITWVAPEGESWGVVATYLL